MDRPQVIALAHGLPMGRLWGTYGSSMGLTLVHSAEPWVAHRSPVGRPWL